MPSSRLWSMRFPLLVCSLLCLLDGNRVQASGYNSMLAQNDEDVVSTYRLPRSHVQFICEEDIRESFLVEQEFAEYFRQLVPPIHDIHLRHSLQINGMEDIAADKWYYRNCNMSSHQILVTMEVGGTAQLSSGNATTSAYNKDTETLLPTEFEFISNLMSVMTPNSLEDYFGSHVCIHMEYFRSHVEDSNIEMPLEDNTKDLDDDPYFEHSLFLLCGGEEYLYDDDDGDIDSGFLIFGSLVGIAMFGMIYSELQKYNEGQPRTLTTSTTPSSTDDSSSSRRSSSRRQQRQRGDYVITPTELEMV